MAEISDKNDLLLPPGTYAYTQEQAGGNIKMYVGPFSVTQSGQERPVVYNHSNRSFVSTSLNQAMQKSIFACEGEYVILENPAENDKAPEKGATTSIPMLLYGRKKNLPGPITFPLWPGQAATVLKGHTLRSNQYLIVSIYNVEAATKNWAASMIDDDSHDEESPKDLAIGDLYIIKGTKCTNYTPPTGIEVVPFGKEYVREAVSLERLEYAILIDQDGNKRYERGPQVVFPNPTEDFFIEDEFKKFRAIELGGKIQGLHIKVIAPYTENNESFQEGQELFVTGDKLSIYFPRSEHSIIKYGTKTKHYATAIPSGEGRYVMDRETGRITTHKGPDMLLPDPRHQVFVRRILTDKQVDLWYPRNTEALAYNRSLRGIAGNQNIVTEDSFSESHDDYCMAMVASAKSSPSETFVRNSSYTAPRQVVLDTKYEGCPLIGIWTGCAVMVVSKTGARRVEIGPKTVILDYDEDLEVLEMSTGKPKNTDKLEKTVYLRISNNKVSDIVDVVTKDHVPVSIKLSLRVNFDLESKEKWFDCENYVKLLTDHIRSMLKGQIRKIEIEKFFSDGVAIVRDIILGESKDGKRLGMKFSENGMRVDDVEVLSIDILADSIRKMLNEAQSNVVSSNISISQAEKDLEVTTKKEQIQQAKSLSQFETFKTNKTLELQRIQEELAVSLSKTTADLQKITEDAKIAESQRKLKDENAQSDLKRQKAVAEFEHSIEVKSHQLRIETIQAETTSIKERCEAIQPGFSEALLTLSNNEALEKIAQASSVQQMIGGESIVDVLTKVFKGSRLSDTFNRMSLPTSKE